MKVKDILKYSDTKGNPYYLIVSNYPSAVFFYHKDYEKQDSEFLEMDAKFFKYKKDECVLYINV